MIGYKNDAYLTKLDNAIFDGLLEPGSNTVHSGIYRCEGCGKAVTSISGNPLPPQNHHEHKPGQGKIQWRLAVWPFG
jgi:hypothetical protein